MRYPSFPRGIAVALALGVVALALVVPVGALLIRSFQAEEVVLEGGQRFRAVGNVEYRHLPGGKVLVSFDRQPQVGGEKVKVQFDAQRVAAVETVFSLDHYRRLVQDPRTRGLLENSFVLAGGAALLALLLGVPIGWILGRTDLPGRRVLAALCIGPAILPPLIVAMGAARPLEAFVHGVTGLTGGALQLGTGMVVFGLVFFPLVAFLTARALAEVPAGPWEAALQLGGRRAAFTRVVLPAVLPALLGGAALVFVLAFSDFAVPDYLGVTLRQGTTPVHVFPTEILLQWKNQGNHARAVATGAPYMLFTAAFLLVAVLLLRRSPVVGGGEGRRGRPPRCLPPAGRAAAFLFVVLVLLVAFALPMAGIASWATGGGEVADIGPDGEPMKASYARLFDVGGAFARTDGIGEQLERWIKSALGAAILATLVAVVLVRWALRGGRIARAIVLLLGVLPLAVPGLVLTVGTNLLWIGIRSDWLDRTMLPSSLALMARFLPFALVAVWLALRLVRPGHEEAAALGGAGRLERAARIWGPLAGRGLLGAALIVLILSLRELDAVILVDGRIFPLRLYDKIHFSRLADEATLSFLYVGILLLPAVLAALVLRPRAERP